MESLVWIAFGIGVGALVSWSPYGYVILPAFGVLVLIYAARYVVDKKFRESPKSGRQMTFYILFWITIAIFHIRPSGMEMFLKPFNANNVKVRDLIQDWRSKAPNIEIICDPVVASKKISIHTVTKITIAEALDIIDKKAAASHSYTQNAQGRSIARGPRITVKISKSKEAPDIGRHHGSPFYYDAF
jgi:hypothetical protein